MLKRKRLAKACDHCHKAKRRCDGTDPCSNCYYAAKPCAYTDATGRPVPAPRQGKTAPAPAPPRPPPLELDPAMTRELTNLFFTHSHPALAIIHKPSFTNALSHNLIPPHLLHAVCALAAIHSKQPSLRTQPHRLAGSRFAAAARAHLFDPEGRLILPPSLHTAQAVCLLTIFELLARDVDPSGVSRGELYRDITLHLLRSLNIHTPDPPLLTSLPSQAYVHVSIERESIRRIFWIIYLIDCTRGLYYRWEAPSLIGSSGRGYPPNPPTSTVNSTAATAPPPVISLPFSLHPPNASSPFLPPLGTTGVMGFSPSELRLRLPADETSFELGVVHESLPEYLYLPAARSQYASELGHLLRVVGIYMRVEEWLDSLVLPNTLCPSHKSPVPPADALVECERLLDEWYLSLPHYLQFTPDTLSIQTSMFPTSSNTATWCYACLHAYHSSIILALGVAKDHLGIPNGPPPLDTGPTAVTPPEETPAVLHQGRFPDSSYAASSLFQPHIYKPSTASTNVPQDHTVQTAFSKLQRMRTLLGSRAQNSMALGLILWPILKYTRCGGPKIRDCVLHYEAYCGVRLDHIARNKRWGDAFVLAGWKEALTAAGMWSDNDDIDCMIGGCDGLKGSVGGVEGEGIHLPTPTHDTGEDIDPVVFTHNANNSDGNHSLPSLKASGLLDWDRDNTNIHTFETGGNRTSPPPPWSGEDPTARSMPVGLPWLANES